MAFNKINLLPGILLWNKKEKVFIPLSQEKGEDELKRLFELINSNNVKAKEFLDLIIPYL